MDESSSELLLVQPVDANEDDFSLRTSLIRKCVTSGPTLKRTKADVGAPDTLQYPSPPGCKTPTST